MRFARILFSCLIVAMFGAAFASAQDDENAVKERIRARVPQVDALKLAKVVGENNKGFLEQRGALAPDQTQVMNAENADRRALYQILATRLGLTVAVVGGQRAEQIRNNSAPGVQLQAADGSWYAK